MVEIIEGAFAYINIHDLLLMILRKNPPYKNHWSLTGGAIEEGENGKQTVVREAKEETNFNVEPMRYLGYIDFSHDEDATIKFRAHVYECYFLGGKFRLGKDILGKRWLNTSQLYELKVAKPVLRFYEELQRTTKTPIRVSFD